MEKVILEKISPLSTREEKYNTLREYLQLLTLKVVDELNGFQNIAFVGGTALRIVYDLKRFSEDLDFCLINTKDYNFKTLIRNLERKLNLYNIDVSTRYKDHKTVASAFIKFDTILHKLNLSPHKDQQLLIKFEVDQNPPKGYNTQLSMINKDFLIGINHFDLPSLFAGKLHALFCRKYQKGRDYYDLIWYLGRKIVPNFSLLNNAILQTEDNPFDINEKNLEDNLLTLIESTDFDKIRLDIEPFLMDPGEIRFFEKEFFVNIIKS